MKSFEIPIQYKSGIIGAVKNLRRNQDKLKKDFRPSLLDFGTVNILLSRHFGFCYGVENAVEIAYAAIDENPGKNIYLLSEMIHNPEVNADLQAKGLKFLMSTDGSQLVEWDSLAPQDVLIIPAFGTTLEIENQINRLNLQQYLYDTTCPFVEKVWKRADQIGKQDYAIIIHGKPSHEETRATFSHSNANAPSLVIKDMKEAEILADFMMEKKPWIDFDIYFGGRYTEHFLPEKHLKKIGVVNQTTMLASDTQAIADFLKNTLVEKYSLDALTIKNHFADTRDTLCYATNDNQTATLALLEYKADAAIVVGGYNSSNTSHLVELCEEKLPTFFIENEKKIGDDGSILHFDLHSHSEFFSKIIDEKISKPTLMLTCGASCPDSVLERVLLKIVSMYASEAEIAAAIANFQKEIKFPEH